MARLTANSTPAERLRGCVFAEDFDSQADFADNGGSIVTTGSVSDGKLNLPTSGTHHALYEGGAAGLSNATGVTVIFEFEPDYALREDERRFFFGISPSGERFDMQRGLVSESSRLFLYIGGTYVGLIEPETFESDWTVNGRNQIAVCAESGSTQVYFNGTAVGGVLLPAFTIGDMTDLKISNRETGVGINSTGKYNWFKIFNQKMTAEEVADYWNNSTYDYRNNTVLDLPMGLAQHDPTNTRTLDVSGNENHIDFAAGAATPTKLVSHAGYSFDGSNDYFNGTLTTEVFNSVNISIVVEFKPDFDTDADAFIQLLDCTNGARTRLVKLNNASSNTLQVGIGNSTVALIPEATYSPFWRTGQRNLLVVSGTTGKTNAWLNGGRILTDDTSAWSATTPTNIYIGSNFSGGSPFDGEIYGVRIWNEVLTELQVLDILETTKKKINDN